MRNRKFKEGDRVRLTKAAKRRFQKELRRVGQLIPAVARGLDDTSSQVGGTGKVTRVDHPGYPRVTVQFPKYHRPLDCSPEDLEQVGLTQRSGCL